MGGYSSTRWNLAHVRPETDPLLSLDVRWLGRIGALALGAVRTPQWSRRGEPVGWITTIREPDGECLILDYATHTLGSVWAPVREAIDLVTTPGHHGGKRIWFLCPGCKSRRAVLFALDGRFRCRACHRLAYSSTREDAAARSRRRLAVLRTSLGGSPVERVWTIPPRPKGMHHRTYARLIQRIMKESGIHNDLADAALDRFLEHSRHL